MTYPIKFCKYLLLERANIGGMAEVFKAKTFGIKGFERILAVKRILPSLAEDEEFINMFVDEARIAVQLSHANIVQVHELGKFENQYYIAMEYVSGKDLRQILDDLRNIGEMLPVPAAAFICSKICDGLDYAHRRTDPTGKPLNLIHRDVSPQNILVSYDGAVKITDFGIAKAEDRASRTQAGVLKGKFGYMSPEQVRGLEIDNRSDVFAVGILLYEMVTGHRLFIGESDFSTLERVRKAEVPPPREYKPDISEALEEIILKALARERDERYHWASELHDDLQQFLIEENTIYNSKRLSALLQETYEEDIASEQSKMEEFAKIGAPVQPEDSVSAAPPRSESGTGNGAQPAWTGAGPQDNEKTMIFESGFDLPSAQTAISPSLSELMAADVPTGPQAPAESSASRHEAPSPSGDATSVGFTPSAHAPAPKRGSAFTVVGLTAVLCAVILGTAFFLRGGSNSTGTITVLSEPIKDVEVLLDGELIGRGTPLTRESVPAGKHIISARAKGYLEKRFSFVLPAGERIKVPIPMEKIPEPSADAPDGVLQVLSEPIGASVSFDGVSKGVTPLTVDGIDRTKPTRVVVSLAGYKTQAFALTFEVEEKDKRLEVRLTKEAAKAVVLGTITIESVPTGATVWLGNQRKGTTPLELTGLPLGKTYSFALTKDGYQRFRKNVPLNSVDGVLVQANLQAGSAAGSPKPATARAPRKGRSGAATSASCSGSAAKLSVMPVGTADCRVTVGSSQLGVAPFFRKQAPAGSCRIVVRCPGGKTYKTSRKLAAGEHTKLIIKKGDW